MKKPFLALAAAFLCACATTANYEKLLSAWVGAEEVDLVRQWGAPSRTYEAGGSKFLTYTSRRNVYMPGAAPVYHTTIVGNTAYTTQVGGTPGYIIGVSCVTTFEVKDGRVVAWQWRGDDCKASAS